ncbi:MAG: cytochrome c [Bdellovibrionales bacterium]|nr:cytochrome c [Bdellovibrionales bacterium]
MKATCLLFSILLTATMSFAKGDANAGKAKAGTCTACHGQNGVSDNDLWPNLKGQKAGYLLQALKDFKSGARKNSLMSPQAQTLSDADMENLAAYFSSLK